MSGIDFRVVRLREGALFFLRVKRRELAAKRLRLVSLNVLIEINAPAAGLEKLRATRAPPSIELTEFVKRDFGCRLPRPMQGCSLLRRTLMTVEALRRSEAAARFATGVAQAENQAGKLHV